MIHADTDGLLDKCHCGAVAGFEEDTITGTEIVRFRPRCTDCAEQRISWELSARDAAISWNKLIRYIKSCEAFRNRRR